MDKVRDALLHFETCIFFFPSFATLIFFGVKIRHCQCVLAVSFHQSYKLNVSEHRSCSYAQKIKFNGNTISIILILINIFTVHFFSFLRLGTQHTIRDFCIVLLLVADVIYGLFLDSNGSKEIQSFQVFPHVQIPFLSVSRYIKFGLQPRNILKIHETFI